MAGVRARGADAGQASVEWIGLVLLVSLVFAAVITAGPGRSVVGVAQAVYGRIMCAIDLGSVCSSDPELAVAYGPELAGEVRANAPEIRYEDGMSALPVDFRACRDADCGNGATSGSVTRSATGQPVVAFVHAVDCRADAVAASLARGYDCSGERAGRLYLQYWLYYEDSTSLRDVPGGVGHHEDDWEGYQVRVGPDGTDARATSHHGYDYDGGAGNWLSDAGVTSPSHWGPDTGSVYISGGSHAGHVEDDAVPVRFTPADGLELVPIETLDPTARRTGFAVDPPWRKPSYRDPED